MKLILLLSAITLCSGYRILGMFPVPTRSHFNLAKGIVNSLLDAGHEVTFITAYSADVKPRKNLTLVDVGEVHDLFKQLDMTNPSNDLGVLLKVFANISRAVVTNTHVQKVLIEEQFDAVTSEWFLSDSDAGYAAVQQVPWIQLCTTTMQTHFENLMDDVRSVPMIPMMMPMMSEYTIPMTFWQRLTNTLAFAFFWLMLRFEVKPTALRYQEFFEPIAQARGVELPPFEEAALNISILFVNQHPSIAPVVSMPPNVVDIAGFHIEEGAPLSKDLQDLLDNSPQGVIYFSLGSVVNPSSIPAETKRDLLQLFGSLPMTVLLKMDDIPKEEVPKNVHVRSWWPQASVLAHKNMKLFMTHGGLLSTIEAVHYGVPLLAIPVFGDQPSNARRALHAGYARLVPFAHDMVPKLKYELDEMLQNDSYYKRAKFLSSIFNNRPAKPSKLISHYVELAIESKGAFHLRSVSHQYQWYARWMLDQLIFISVILAIVYAGLKRVVRFLWLQLRGNRANKVTKVAQKKVKRN